ncbi:MAG: hypothetical protein K0M45_08970 [Candidatus Paracaedibacteraceae bacterium]|nr:hypothetical protein [Candidatus Paracaedibacteraceae bacterium]
MKISTSLLLCLSLLLSACQTPRITENYDHFSQTKICKLEPYQIRVEYRGPTGRNTFITLSMEKDGMIKGIITSEIRRGVFANYDEFTQKSKIKFILTTVDQKVEELIFPVKELSKAHNTYSVVSEYITLTFPLINVLVTFNMTPDQLNQIINAPKVDFYFESGKDPIEGTFGDAHKEAFKQFLNKCTSTLQAKK